MMNKLTFYFAFSLALTALAVQADEIPLPALATKGNATTPLGIWSLRGWSDHHKYPALKESVDALPVTAKDGKPRWEVTGNNAAMTILPDKLAFAMGGTVFKNGWEPRYNWIPALQFKPAQPGAYRLEGQLNLWGRGFANQKVVAWAAGRWQACRRIPAWRPAPHRRACSRRSHW